METSTPAPITFRRLAELRDIVGDYADSLRLEYTGCPRDVLNTAVYAAQQTVNGEYDTHPDGPAIRAHYSGRLRHYADQLKDNPAREPIAAAMRELAAVITHGNIARILPDSLAALPDVGEYVAAHVRNTRNNEVHAYVVSHGDDVLELVDETGSELASAHFDYDAPYPGWYFVHPQTVSGTTRHTRTSAVKILRTWGEGPCGL
ncbi:hypothetical protein ACFVWN_01255 [Nocardiopsis flavescens]|uniref:hypothetical protein n=1 Tax=Nocardiopsis flavescens TaxID=758803 RepID=UPI00365336AC